MWNQRVSHRKARQSISFDIFLGLFWSPSKPSKSARLLRGVKSWGTPWDSHETPHNYPTILKQPPKIPQTKISKWKIFKHLPKKGTKQRFPHLRIHQQNAHKIINKSPLAITNKPPSLSHHTKKIRKLTRESPKQSSGNSPNNPRTHHQPTIIHPLHLSPDILMVKIPKWRTNHQPTGIVFLTQPHLNWLSDYITMISLFF
jgi:hypothetical protein